MKVKIESEVVQSFLTLSDPMDCSPPGSSVHGIFQVRVLEGGAIGVGGALKSRVNITKNACKLGEDVVKGSLGSLGWTCTHCCI